MKLDKVAEYLMNIDLSKFDGLKTDFGTIHDAQKFVNSHIEILTNNPGNKLFMPYRDRLKSFYLIVIDLAE